MLLSYFIQCLFLFILFHCRQCRGALKCKICAINQSGYHLDIEDNQRISYESQKPYCRRFDTVVCDRNQDICITVVQQMESKNSRSYLILKGCSYKWKHPKVGCTTKTEAARKPQVYEFGRRERPVSVNQPTETCVCDYDSCNKARSKSCRIYMWIILFWLFILMCVR